jgi:dGTPase
VAPSNDTALFHNRLTHSLKVAQVGKRTAAYLIKETEPGRLRLGGGLDPATVGAAGRAHDIGHPPFGHVAEKEFQRILGADDGKVRRLPDSFEGNAQTFRILTKLAAREFKKYEPVGLGLTAATLAAVSKYPWLKSDDRSKPHNKWGAYDSETDALRLVLDLIDRLEGHDRTLEADIMDWADDVTYAVHDIEDFFRFGFIPLHIIREGAASAPGQHSAGVFEEFLTYASINLRNRHAITLDGATRESFGLLCGLFPTRTFNDSNSDRVMLNELTSKLVTRFQRDLTVDRHGRLQRGASQNLLELLKQLTWFFVIDQPPLATLQWGEVGVVRDLVFWLTEWAADAFDTKLGDQPADDIPRKHRMPVRLHGCVTDAIDDSASHEYDEQQSYTRGVVDYIASLTEAQAYELHGRLGGQSHMRL